MVTPVTVLADWVTQPDSPYKDGARPQNTRPSGSVSITGTIQEDEVLSITNTLTDPDTLGSFSYQWKRDGGNISGATSATYTLVTADVDTDITVTVSYTDGAAQAESKTSAAVGPVIAAAGESFGVPAIYLPDSTQFIHHSVPVRAYPDIDLDFKLTGYDWFNRTITWDLTTFPTGMTINSSTGIVSWTPSSQDGDHSVVATMTPAGGTTTTKSWTVNVNTSDFVFIATNGSDANSGTLVSPYATLGKAGEETSSGVGKTVLCRGGTYTAAANIDITTFQNKSFTEASNTHIRSYPGEAAIFDQVDTYFGFRFNTDNYQYIIVDDLEIKDTYGEANDSGGIMLRINATGKRLTVHGSDWPDNWNCAGIWTVGGAMVDSCYAYDNKNTGVVVQLWNSSNFLHYSDKGSGDAFWIDCISGAAAGDSPTGFKVKHPGTNGRLHIHRGVSRYSRYSSFFADDYSSVRHSLLYSVGTSNGALGNYTNGDIGVSTDDGMLWQSNLMILDNNDHNEAQAFTHRAPNFFYTETADEGMKLLENDIVTVQTPTSAGYGSPIAIGRYTSLVNIQDVDFEITDNNFYLPSDANVMERGGNNMLDTAGVNAVSTNSGNTYAGTVPATMDKTVADGTYRFDRDAQTVSKV